VKNIFRVRPPQAVGVLEGSEVELTAPMVDEAMDDVPAEVMEPDFGPVVMPYQYDLAAVDPEPAQETDLVARPVPAEMPEQPHSDFAVESNGRKDWVSGYVVPEMEAILAEIQELKELIQEMEQRKLGLEMKVNEREVLRNALLTGSGAQLKQAVEHIFNELGVNVQTGSADRTDIVLEHKGLDFVSEVVACEGSIGLGNIRQLNHWVEDFIESNGRQPKGLLIANPFCHTPLDQRENNGHVAFPAEIRLLAEQRYKFGLLTTPQLFVAYCKFKEGQLDINELMTELFETVWVYGNHRDYDRFKVSTQAI
jgi:hypothetical protein